ncbi:MAG: copper homeostasis protein CutC [Gemmatimonadota bacterium]|nr:copper homeostasis protein CutC [Gemmatimonadota bacterium]
MPEPVVIEACVDSIDSAIEAQLGGADRVELCGELLQGGVTASAGLIGGVCERITIPVFALVRPRAGDFLYDDDELDVMLRDIEIIRSLNVEGIVIGALTRDGDIDIGTMYTLIAAAGDMNVTFHRAFDFVKDQRVALEALIELGVDRVLTSGGAATALEGATMVAELVEQGGADITILAGGSINAANVAEVVFATGVTEVHVRAAARVKSEMTYQPSNVSLARAAAPRDYERMSTRAEEMRRVVSALRPTR